MQAPLSLRATQMLLTNLFVYPIRYNPTETKIKRFSGLQRFFSENEWPLPNLAAVESNPAQNLSQNVSGISSFSAVL